jgi:hypothetical protein
MLSMTQTKDGISCTAPSRVESEMSFAFMHVINAHRHRVWLLNNGGSWLHCIYLTRKGRKTSISRFSSYSLQHASSLHHTLLEDPPAEVVKEYLISIVCYIFTSWDLYPSRRGPWQSSLVECWRSAHLPRYPPALLWHQPNLDLLRFSTIGHAPRRGRNQVLASLLWKAIK